MSGFTRFSDEQIQIANQKDIGEFLRKNGEELKRVGNQLLWERNQVWVKENCWYSHYDGKGGNTVGFVMQYFNLPFREAMEALLGDQICLSASYYRRSEASKTINLAVPAAHKTMSRVYDYLLNHRCLSKKVVDFFVFKRILYEDSKYHNAVFIGTDENNIPRHVHLRGTFTNGNRFIQTVAGSDCRYSFNHIGTSDTIYVFESPIDMLAFISMNDQDWQRHSYVALCCVAEHALLHQLSVNSNIKNIVLCLDNDLAGIKATERISQVLNSKGYQNVSVLIPEAKDWDEDLQNLCREEQELVIE